jgi:hypothetical protein
MLPSHLPLLLTASSSSRASAARSDLHEARDISWAIGVGTADDVTLPYLLSQYAAHSDHKYPIVRGASTTAVIPRDPVSAGKPQVVQIAEVLSIFYPTMHP